MSLLSSLKDATGRLSAQTALSMRRAKLEGERRLLQRQHRAALEELGERTYELARAGRIAQDQIAPEVAAIDAKLGEIEAKVFEIEGLRDDPADAGAAPATAAPTEAEPAPRDPAWRQAERFFRS